MYSSCNQPAVATTAPTEPRLRRIVTEVRLGDGTIDIARGLKGLLPWARLNDVMAQYALVSWKMQDVSAEVQEAIGMYGQDLVGVILPVLQWDFPHIPKSQSNSGCLTPPYPLQ